ncbi:MAG: DUF4105 domain-containing protein [Candidatus Thalassarchaeum sp.]
MGWGSAQILAGLALSIVVVWHFSKTPSNDRDWVTENGQIAYAEFEDDEVVLRNVRDFEWRTTRDFDEHWTEWRFKPSEVSKIWLVLEYFDPKRKPIAHTLVSFEFKDGRRLACSIEVRREKGEAYHPIRGMLRQYELLYVWSTERDSIGVRARCRRKSKTHLFEGVVLGENNHQRLLESFLRRTNSLHNRPEWYNSITNTCTTNIVGHVNEIYPGRVPRAVSIFLPGLSPNLLERNNLIRIDEDLDRTLESSLIDQRSAEWDTEVDYGDWIRSG